MIFLLMFFSGVIMVGEYNDYKAEQKVDQAFEREMQRTSDEDLKTLLK